MDSVVVLEESFSSRTNFQVLVLGRQVLVLESQVLDNNTENGLVYSIVKSSSIY